jgi:hypothetical protein
MQWLGTSRRAEIAKEPLWTGRKRSRLLKVRSSFKPPLAPVPILQGRPQLKNSVFWKSFGNFIPNFRDWIANEKHPIPNQNQHGDHLDRRHFRAPGTAVIQLGRVNEGNLRGSAGSARGPKDRGVPSAKTKMKIRNQKLATPILIRILRRLVRRRAFQQRKAKPGTSHVEGPGRSGGGIAGTAQHSHQQLIGSAGF